MDHNRRTMILLGLAVVFFLALMLFAVNDDGDDGGSTADLNGTSWTVESLVVDGVASPPIDGVTMTAAFDGGEVAGSAGCNNYFGSYETDGDHITFGPLGSTKRLCPDPPGADEREHVYLALLGGAERYSVDGGQLTIEAAGGGQIIYGEG